MDEQDAPHIYSFSSNSLRLWNVLGWVSMQTAAFGFGDDSTDPIRKIIAVFKNDFRSLDSSGR